MSSYVSLRSLRTVANSGVLSRRYCRSEASTSYTRLSVHIDYGIASSILRSCVVFSRLNSKNAPRITPNAQREDIRAGLGAEPLHELQTPRRRGRAQRRRYGTAGCCCFPQRSFTALPAARLLMGVHLSGKTAVLEEFIRQHARQEEASSSCAASSGGRDAVALPRLRHARPAQPAVLSPTVPFQWSLSGPFRRSFSAVSTPIFAAKHICRIFSTFLRSLECYVHVILSIHHSRTLLSSKRLHHHLRISNTQLYKISLVTVM